MYLIDKNPKKALKNYYYYFSPKKNIQKLLFSLHKERNFKL